MDLTDTVDIPSGAVQTRTMLGVPTEVALLMLCLAAIPFLALRSLWILAVLPVVWGFLKYQAHRDPAFLQIWAGQMQFADYYTA